MSRSTTPGAYLPEPGSFPSSIVGVETAVPCLIGYTEKAKDRDGRDLAFVPKRIECMTEFIEHFGERHKTRYYLIAAAGSEPLPRLADGDIDRGEVKLGGASRRLAEVGGTRFNLFDGMRLFYANGGGGCFVISCGTFGGGRAPAVSADAIAEGLAICRQLVGPTMVAIPDSVLLTKEEHGRIAALLLRTCAEAGDRMALIDVHGADRWPPEQPWAPLIAEFRASLEQQTSPGEWSFGAAYFPALVTSVVGADEIDRASFPRDAEILAQAEALPTLQRAAAATQGILPPSAALAGLWSSNDATRGVWNAPANVGIAGTVRPTLPISLEDQGSLSVPLQGLAVNAIRAFPRRGNVVWGARTLDGNSDEWRYIQVRRTLIYLEQSVKQALQSWVFSPNTAQTWATVVAMIESFLHGLWASGGLMGATPGEAYDVQAGLGSTMTSEDIVEGVMRVQITLRMVPPAGFIELSFRQQMLGGG